MSILGDWIMIASPMGVRVKTDDQNTIYVTVDKTNTEGETIRGLCGDSDGDNSIAGEY